MLIQKSRKAKKKGISDYDNGRHVTIRFKSLISSSWSGISESFLKQVSQRNISFGFENTLLYVFVAENELGASELRRH